MTQMQIQKLIHRANQLRKELAFCCRTMIRFVTRIPHWARERKAAWSLLLKLAGIVAIVASVIAVGQSLHWWDISMRERYPELMELSSFNNQSLVTARDSNFDVLWRRVVDGEVLKVFLYDWDGDQHKEVILYTISNYPWSIRPMVESAETLRWYPAKWIILSSRGDLGGEI